MTVPGGYVAGDVLTAANLNLLPAGRVNSVATGSSQTGIGTTATNLTSLSASVTAVAGRRYRVSGMVNFRQRTSAGMVSIELYQDTIDIMTTAIATYAIDDYGTLSASWPVVPGAGTWTFRLRAKTSAGTVDINPFGSAFILSHLLVEDIGT